MRTNKSFGHRLAPTFWLAFHCCVIFAYGKPANPLLSFPSSALAQVSPQVASDCMRDALAYLTALKSGESWAVAMYSASTNVAGAIQSISIYSMGDYDKCLQVEVPESKSHSSFHGEYCMSSIVVSVPGMNIRSASLENNHHASSVRATKGASNSITLSWAFCMPSTCPAEDVTTLLDQVLKFSLAGQNITTNVVTSQCSKKEESSLNAAEIAMVCLLTFFGILAIASTWFDVHKRLRGEKIEGTCNMLLSSFSLWTNGKKLLFGNPGESVMACLHGIRFLSMSWIVFGHTFYMCALAPIKNVEYILELPKDWSKMLVLNETVSVDTFFLLSGLLLAFVFLRDREKGSRFNFIAYYLHRYIRLTPPYAIMIGFYATLFAKIGSGPYWENFVGLSSRDYCVENWWTNLLYVNNYVNLERPCLGQTWYLAVDMQFYWVAPLLLIPLWHWRRLAKFLIPAAILLSIVPPTTVTAVERLPGGSFLNGDPDKVALVFKHVYVPAWTRAGPYIVGIGLGYLLHIFRGKQIKLPKVLVAFCWVLSAVCCLAVIFGAYGMMQTGYVYNRAEATLYAGLHRTVWAIGVAWVIFACIHGYGGPVNTLLSWKAMAPLSRLTYAAYLSHFVVIMYNAGITRTPAYLSAYYVTRDFLGNLTIILAISVVVSLVFEAPFMTISKVLLRGGGKPPGVSKPKLMYGSTETTKEQFSVNVDEEASSGGSEAPNLGGEQKEHIFNKHSYENKAFDAVT